MTKKSEGSNGPAELSTATFRRRQEVVRAMGHEVRAKILALLLRTDKRRTVSDIVAELSMGQPLISQYLIGLARKNILKAHKDGTRAYYEINGAETTRVIQQVLDVLTAPAA